MTPVEISPQHRDWRRRVFLLTWLGYAGFYLCRKNFSVCMPVLADEYGYSVDDFALVVTIYLVMYALGQFVNGYLSDRWGPRIIVGTGLFISASVNVGLGVSASLTLFFIFNLFNGLAQSTGWSGTVKNMASWFLPRERGVVMGWWSTCYVVGGFVATNFATFWITNEVLFAELGWRRGFFVPAASLFLIALAYVVFTRNRPEDAGLAGLHTEAAGEGSADTSEGAQDLRAAFADAALWIICITYFFLKLNRYAFLFWLPTYMTEALDYTPAQAGYLSSVYELVGFTGVVAAGYLSDKVFRARRFPVGALMLFGLAAGCLVYPVLSHSGFFLNALGIGLIGCMTFGPDALMSASAAMDIGGRRGAGTVVGTVNGVGSVGAALSPAVVAMVSARYGWNTLFYLFVVTALLSAVLLSLKWNYGGQPLTREGGGQEG